MSAFRVCDNLQSREDLPRFGNLRGCEFLVHHTGPVGRDNFLVDSAGFQLVAQVVRHQTVGHKKNPLRGQCSHDIVHVPGSDTDVRFGLNLSGAVDVADYRCIGVQGFQPTKIFAGD